MNYEAIKYSQLLKTFNSTFATSSIHFELVIIYYLNSNNYLHGYLITVDQYNRAHPLLSILVGTELYSQVSTVLAGDHSHLTV